MLGKRPTRLDNLFWLYASKPGVDAANAELKSTIDEAMEEVRSLQAKYRHLGAGDTASTDQIANYVIWRLIGGRLPGDPPEAQIRALQTLVAALEAGGYRASPSSTVKGSALQVEDLEPVMMNATYWSRRPKRALGETRASWERHQAYWNSFWGGPTSGGNSTGEVPLIEYCWWVPKFLRRSYGDKPKPFVFQPLDKSVKTL